MTFEQEVVAARAAIPTTAQETRACDSVLIAIGEGDARLCSYAEHQMAKAVVNRWKESEQNKPRPWRLWFGNRNA